jgi:signal transduction histidine kinase/PAS domain-containing protein
VSTDTAAEILRLRAGLRDLVALYTIPATWVGREPRDVAEGLADALIGLLQLDFAFVRLCDPGGVGAVEAIRGDAWTAFPRWLERHLATNGRLSYKEVVANVGDRSYRGVVIPIGVDAERGVVAAASDRPDYPTEIDQLLLSLAANHAATSFQGARLIDERRSAEDDLRRARNELEVMITERTAELQRSDAYLAEAQRLTHTGSFALSVPSGEPTHSSDEHSRLYGFDPEQGIPSLSQFLQRIHPDDRAGCAEALVRAIRRSASFEIEYRVALPPGPLKHLRAVAHPVLSASGEIEEFVGTVVDVTEQKRAEEERQGQLWFFESMDGINRAIQRNRDLEQTVGDVLDVVLAIFGCDRAWLAHPGDPEGAARRVQMERTRPEDPGASGPGADILDEAEIAAVFRRVLASSSPVRFDPDSGLAVPSAPDERFAIRSMLAMAVHPKVDTPYVFGLHKWSDPRVWTSQEVRLFEAIGRRLADALDTLVMFRDLQQAHQLVEASRDKLRRLAEEQAALRRVATLVARGVSSGEVFETVTREVGLLFGADIARMERYESDGTVTFVADWSRSVEGRLSVGTRLPLEGLSIAARVRETTRPVRVDSFHGAAGAVAQEARALGIRASVGCPIVVEDRLWGVIAASTRGEAPFPAGTESRIGEFTALVATAIANAESRGELLASRARVLAAGDEARRHVVRDLHDGAQQRLVHTIITLKRALHEQHHDQSTVQALVAEGLEHAEAANAELRELAHGLHPSVLALGGLAAGVDALVSRTAVPVTADVSPQRLAPEIEASAYFVVAEALTNVAKHSEAHSAEVKGWVAGGALHLEIRDDGVGGAHAAGPGLIGLADRLAALGGRLRVESPPNRGTLIAATLPLTLTTGR